jgi:hypothetical protein
MALVLTFGLLPAVTPTAAAADSVLQPYLDKVVEWRVMRGDVNGNLNAERNITRAEFVTMVNRAYGYTETGPNPFRDVSSSDWFYDDICIAARVGYFKGTTSTTASPYRSLTREQAAVLLGRNMMLEETSGEALGFTDSRSLQPWSRGMIQALTEAGVINGYSDGSFRPQNPITRGAVAAMLVRAIGTPVQSAGDYTLGDVYGNVTITSSGVTLRNTTIAGDLYLTGGIGLGDTTLENVKVLGRIVVSGAGESEKGGSSILLRNVTAENMLVDNISNQFVTLRSEGATAIDTTSVRTPSYIEDATTDDYGLKYIKLDGEAGTSLQLAGNIKEVRNLTSGSILTVAQGVADQVTVDETATGSTLSIDNSARIRTLNLDTATTVQGSGDVANLNVNAAGSTVAMLPDQIVVRPGITANVAGEVMDTVAAAESSEDPRLLAGYPTARDVAPNSATAVFSTNKKGTVYWAISALADGSVSEADLITPPAYSGKIVKSGSIPVTASKTEVTVKLSGLTVDGSYYLSAVLVDSRGQRSPVKVSAFTTPDNTVPAFATGYPAMTLIEKNRAQVTVMSTKSCQLYYALLPKGSTAPKAADFKANAVSGNLGFGSMDVVKNTTYPFFVSERLSELTSYDLYLWLTDYDGAKSSAVKKITFTTVDGTPPIVRQVYQSDDSKPTSVGITFTINEPGTLYWAIVKKNADFLRPLTGQQQVPAMDSDAAKIQVVNGLGAIKKGNASASKGDTSYTFTISGLTSQTSYDLYYVAKDKAGNYSDSVEKITVNTQDNEAPTVEQEFTLYNGDTKTEPLPDTDIRLVFSESIAAVQTDANTNVKSYIDLMDIPTGMSLAQLLREHFVLQERTSSTSNDWKTVAERTKDGQTAWTIDYRYAKVTMEDGKMVVTFPTNTKDPSKSALNLKSGAWYRFRLNGISDTSGNHNEMSVKSMELSAFRTVFAQVNMEGTSANTTTDGVRLDLSFQLTPVSTSKVPADERWDMVLWTDTRVSFKLYRRELTLDENNTKVETSPWAPVGSEAVLGTTPDTYEGFSLTKDILKTSTFQPFTDLVEGHIYEYGIHFTKVNGVADSNYDSWSDLVTMKVAIVSGADLDSLCTNITQAKWKTYVTNGQTVTSIGLATTAQGAESDELTLKKQFSDQSHPQFSTGYPNLSTGNLGSSAATVDVILTRAGTIYYVVAPASDVPLAFKDNTQNAASISDLTAATKTTVELTSPDAEWIMNPKAYFGNSTTAKYGSLPFTGSRVQLDLTDLIADQDYYAFFVLKGSGKSYTDTMVYKFHTEKAKPPIVTLQAQNPSVKITVDTDSYLYYALVEYNNLPGLLTAKFSPEGVTDATLKAKLEKMTVLEAMTSADSTGRSYFDLYAGSTLRQDVMEYISGSGGSGGNTITTTSQPYVQGNTPNLKAGGSISPDFSKTNPAMKRDTEYCLLAAARHVYGDTYGFKAVTSVFNPDNTAPEYSGDAAYLQPRIDYAIEKGDTSKTKVYDATWSASYPGNYLYSGIVNIKFDKEVYYSVLSGSNYVRKAVVMRAKDTTAATDGTISALNIIGGSQTKFGVGTATTTATNTLTFSFEDLADGDQLILFADGSISNSSGTTTAKKLVLTFDTTLTTTNYTGLNIGTAYPGFRVQWK